MDSILKISNLTKKYGLLTAVSDLSFDIEKGSVYGILGPNGSGKSNLFEALEFMVAIESASDIKQFGSSKDVVNVKSQHSIVSFEVLFESSKRIAPFYNYSDEFHSLY